MDEEKHINPPVQGGTAGGMLKASINAYMRNEQ
jgi:hypothetical protein